MRSILFTILSLLLFPFISLSQPAPNFIVMDTNGQTLDLYDDYLNQGKTVVLELFWDGCPTCNSFAPFLGELYKDWGNGARDVEFIALNTQSFERDSNVRAFQERHNHTWPGVSMQGGSLGASQPYRDGTYGTRFGDPTIVVLTPDGTVNFKPNGNKLGDEGKALIDAAIRATGASKPTDDVTGPVFTIQPAVIADISCADPLPIQENLVATDSCGVQITATVDDYEESMCAPYTITYRWTAADSCGNNSVLTRTFRVLPDTLAPTFDKEPSLIANVTCGDANPTPETLTASSACGPAKVEFFIDDYTPDLCTSNTIVYRWVATSPCGKTTETSMSFITTYDRQPPVFDSEPDSIPDIRCNQTLPLPQTLTASTNCTEVTVNFSVDDYEEDLCNGYPITYRWVAADACGRNTVRTRTFMVQPDTSALVFSQEPTSFSDIECGENFPTADVITYSSRCAASVPTTLSIERSSEEDCGRTITYRYVALDHCGNEVVKTSSFQVREAVVTTKTLTGTVTNAQNTGVGEVTLSVTGATMTNIQTNAQGQFSIPDLPINASYTVRPSKEGNITEGVTSFDLVQINSHILGISPFTEEAQMIAADVNASNSVTTFDVVLIRRVILGIDDSFEAGSWRFVPEQIELASLEAINNLSFTAIKIGDVSGASSSFTTLATESRNSKKPVALWVANQSYQSGEIVDAIFTTATTTSLLGFQFTLQFAPESLELLSVENIGLTDFHAANMNLQLKERGLVAMSWFDVAQASKGALFKVRFRANTSGQLKNHLSLNSSITKAEAYRSATTVAPIDLQFQHSPDAFEETLLFPNPTNRDFTLQTSLGEARPLTIQVLSLDGKILQEQQYGASQLKIQTIPVSIPAVPVGMYWVKIIEESGRQEIQKLVKRE